MERHIMNYDGLSASVNSIGCTLYDGTFYIDEDALEVLEEIWQLLEKEDKSSLPIRRQLAILKFGPNVLIPLLTQLQQDSGDTEDSDKDGEKEEEEDDEEDEEEGVEEGELDREQIFSVALKLLVFLTEPISAILGQYPTFATNVKLQEDVAVQREMTMLFRDIYSHFLKPSIHNTLLAAISTICKLPTTTRPLSDSDIQHVNCFLYLYRNILSYTATGSDRVIIIKMMFAAGFENFCRFIFTSPQKAVWSVSLAQLLPLLYQDKCDVFSPIFDPRDVCDADANPLPGNTSLESSTLCVTTGGNESDISSSDTDFGRNVNTPTEACQQCQHSPMSGDSQQASPMRGESPMMGESSSNDSKQQPAAEMSAESKKNIAAAIHQMQVDSAIASATPTLSGSSSDGDIASDDIMTSVSSNTDQPSSLAARHFFIKLEQKLDENLQMLYVRKNLQHLAELFVEEGLADLLHTLKSHYLSGNKSGLSFIYFTWILQYFVKFAVGAKQLERLSEVVTVDVVGFLVYHVVSLQEQSLLLPASQAPTPAATRELRMCIGALSEVIDLVGQRSEEDSLDHPGLEQYITDIRPHIALMRPLRELFPLLIRHYNVDAADAETPAAAPIDVLADIVALNHKVLLLLEAAGVKDDEVDMYEHVSNFACPSMMTKLARCLGDLRDVEPPVIDAVFTMMHHVVSNLGALDSVMQWPILQAMCRLDEDVVFAKLRPDHLDIVNYMLRQLFTNHNYVFLNSQLDPNRDPEVTPAEALRLTQLVCEVEPRARVLPSTSGGGRGGGRGGEQPMQTSEAKSTATSPSATKSAKMSSASGGEASGGAEVAEEEDAEWTEDEVDLLFKVSCEEEDTDNVDNMIKSLKSAGLEKSTFQTLLKLLSLDLIPELGFQAVVAKDAELVAELRRYLQREEHRAAENHGNQTVSLDDAVTAVKDGCEKKHVQWLQQQLMEVCYVKLGGRELEKPYAEDPVFLHHALQHKSLPLVSYTAWQDAFLALPALRTLLVSMGAVLPMEGATVYPRLPSDWNAVDFYVLVRRLGDTDHLSPLKVEESDLVKDAAAARRFQKQKAEMTTVPDTASGGGASELSDKDVEIPQNLWPQVISMFNRSLKVE